MKPRLRALWWCVLLLPLLTLQAGAISTLQPLLPETVSRGAAVPPPSPVPVPRLLAAPAGVPATSRADQLKPHGYVEEEFFLQGQVIHHRPEPGWGKEGHWRVQAHGEPHPYLTRLLIRRPADPTRFNGVIVVEWLNTTPGFDLDGGWILTREELMAQGYGWVGVSTQTEGLRALQQQSSRYAQVHLASNAGSHGVFSQAGQAIRTHWQHLLGQGTTPGAGSTSIQPASGPRLLALGYSQSGLYLYTYINTFHPQHQVFDGFYLRGPAPMAPGLTEEDDDIWAPVFRTDLNVPIMQVQTEAEAMVSWPLSRTPDTDKVRYWEISGAAHLDEHLQSELAVITPPPERGTPSHCLHALNQLPAYMVDHAALHALTRWVQEGMAPPIAPRMTRNSLGFIRTDRAGHGLAGLRLPDIRVPTAHHGQYNNIDTRSLSVGKQYACIAGGSTEPFETAELQSLYPDRSTYLQAYQAAADDLLAQGFLRPRDHQHLMERANAYAATRWASEKIPRSPR